MDSYPIDNQWLALHQALSFYLKRDQLSGNYQSRFNEQDLEFLGWAHMSD